MEATERLDASGKVLRALAEDEIAGLVSTLTTQGIEALAISFLHADRNSAHERLARQLLQRHWPDGSLVLGSEVCPFRTNGSAPPPPLWPHTSLPS